VTGDQKLLVIIVFGVLGFAFVFMSLGYWICRVDIEKIKRLKP
jgi:hypothetical protein